jgi:CheY-like chemotaxis protein
MFVAIDAEAILTDAGHQVVGIAPSADEAVSSAAHLGPDVVLMDVRLQGQRDGIEAAAEIRSRFGLPVIFVTANVDPVTHARAMQVGPLALVSKPFTSESLLGALKSLTGS